MSDAPERIWVEAAVYDRTWEHSPASCLFPYEYVRIDLVEAAEQQGYASAMEAERKLHEDRIEELETKLEKAMQVVEMIASADVDAVLGQAVDLSCEIIGELMEDEEDMAKKAGVYRIVTTLAELKGETDG